MLLLSAQFAQQGFPFDKSTLPRPRKCIGLIADKVNIRESDQTNFSFGSTAGVGKTVKVSEQNP